MEGVQYLHRPNLNEAGMVIGFSGWMDGGDVSTGMIKYLVRKLQTEKFAHIDPEVYCVSNLSGTMEQVAQYRPYVRIEEGLIKEFLMPENIFYCSEANNLVLFSGKEPNLRWKSFAQAMFEVVEICNVRRIYFVGSVGGLTPHTRDPRVFCSLSDETFKYRLNDLDVRFSDYEGPSSFVNLLNVEAAKRGLEMINFVVDIPTYVQATNPRGIATVLKRIVRLLDLDISLEELVILGDEFQKNIDKLVAKMPDLLEQIKRLEENYDKEIWEDDQSFQEWLKRHGIDKL
ncbi:MAG TPA: PAC2 family protein [Atribacteraceae bacterium]|nr:PAC2 family protein [Atribacteraceae bacterium]